MYEQPKFTFKVGDRVTSIYSGFRAVVDTLYGGNRVKVEAEDPSKSGTHHNGIFRQESRGGHTMKYGVWEIDGKYVGEGMNAATRREIMEGDTVAHRKNKWRGVVQIIDRHGFMIIKTEKLSQCCVYHKHEFMM